MSPQVFLPLLRELSSAYQAFAAYGSAHIRTLGLTPSQFDIIATLGNTEGMPFKELGEKTLITKGTLTGVVDRLQDKALVQRVGCPTDGRSQLVQLTPAGQALFEQCFPAHLAYIDAAMNPLSESDVQALTSALTRLRLAFHPSLSTEET